MGQDKQPVASSSKKEKRFRFSQAGKAFLKDYFHNRNSYPKKKERQEILAHLKEIGDTEAADTSLVNWFTSIRQAEKKRRSLLSIPVTEPDEGKWVDARHKSLWPSVKKESFRDLELLHTEHVAQEGDVEPPYDIWAEGLEAEPEHLRRWCKLKARKSSYQIQPTTAVVVETLSRMTEEHSQLPTPGNSTSPEPSSLTACLPPPPDVVKDEPPVSPVTTQFCTSPEGPKEGPREKSSMGLHEAIESAFSLSLLPPVSSIQSPMPPSPATRKNQQTKSTSRSSSRTLHIVPPPTPPSISTKNITDSALTLSPSASIASPSPKRISPLSLSHFEPPTPLSPGGPIPGPPAQPVRDIASERATLVADVAAKLGEIDTIFSSPYGLSQLAGSIQGISQRNQQFLNDVAAGRFAHSRLTSAHLSIRQAADSMPGFSPLRVLADWQDSTTEGKERDKEGDKECEMEVD